MSQSTADPAERARINFGHRDRKNTLNRQDLLCKLKIISSAAGSLGRSHPHSRGPRSSPARDNSKSCNASERERDMSDPKPTARSGNLNPNLNLDRNLLYYGVPPTLIYKNKNVRYNGNGNGNATRFYVPPRGSSPRLLLIFLCVPPSGPPFFTFLEDRS